jgi:hypothetical protein
MTKSLSLVSAAAAAFGAWAVMRALDGKNKSTITASAPFFVKHPGAYPGQFNEGLGNNHGVIGEITKPLARAEDGRWSVGWGLTPGFYKNSHHNQSQIAGVKLKGEFDVSKRFFIESGSYVGAVTGYQENLTPALLLYVGVGLRLTDRFSMSLRVKWLPARTVGGFSADSWVGALNIGSRPIDS